MTLVDAAVFVSLVVGFISIIFVVVWLLIGRD